MMKKALSVLSVMSLVGLLLAGCGNSEPQPAASNQTTSGGNAGSEVQMEGELVVAGNGSTVEKLMKDKIFKKFNEKYPNVKLTYVPGVSTEIVAQVKAQKNAPQIDVAVIEGGEQEKGHQAGLWEPITEKDVPNMNKVPKEYHVSDNSGVTVNVTPIGISYNAKLVEEKGLPIPKSWNDLTKPEMKGYITMAGITSNFGRSPLIMLSYANGGSEKDMDPGFEKLKIIAGYMPTFAKSSAQLMQNLQNESAAYTTWTMARSLVLKDSGLPLEFVFPEEGGNAVLTVASQVKGAQHPVAAKAFIDFLLTDEIQTMYATDLFYSPSVDVKLPDDVAKMLEFDRSKVVTFDNDVVASKTAEWLDRFNKEVAPLAGK
ncbi:ABC transporter substrate-binding protein [Brevibacillus humidisoli]|uniref:ABC transporter substrate-binding protein n=1 Tax=Brevibacillus humidisoli TaxID=2895522 RepID=UPI001E58BC7D|nr:ABC transporter substrate-binding protein [Brevibacillus humidisoli]UFJ41142.1 ABC transporter substrate-binding protein [Brevibacillus humidisoli]